MQSTRRIARRCAALLLTRVLTLTLTLVRRTGAVRSSVELVSGPGLRLGLVGPGLGLLWVMTLTLTLSLVRRTGAVRSSVELVSGPAGATETAVSVAADVVTRVVVATLVNV